MTSYIRSVHKRFINDFLEACQIDSSPISAIPSIIFLSLAFCLIYSLVHRRRTYTFKMGLYQSVVFHWSYFYATRLWLLLLKAVRYCSSVVEQYSESNQKNGFFYVDHTIIRGITFSILLTCAMIPGMLLLMKHLYTQSIPNFLIWVGEDPWRRTEIGVSGHYLDRPPNVMFPGTRFKDKQANRARSSSSVEPLIKQEYNVPRNCKSMDIINKDKGLICLA